MRNNNCLLIKYKTENNSILNQKFNQNNYQISNQNFYKNNYQISNRMKNKNKYKNNNEILRNRIQCTNKRNINTPLKETLEDMCIIGKIIEEKIIYEKKKNLQKFIEIKDAVKAKNKNSNNRLF